MGGVKKGKMYYCINMISTLFLILVAYIYSLYLHHFYKKNLIVFTLSVLNAKMYLLIAIERML